MSNAIDPVSLGILWDRLISITNEIVQTLVRTSFSSVARENYDLSCVLFDGRGQAVQALQFHDVLGGPQTTQHHHDGVSHQGVVVNDVNAHFLDRLSHQARRWPSSSLPLICA